jgi:hypothetical protein
MQKNIIKKSKMIKNISWWNIAKVYFGLDIFL